MSWASSLTDQPCVASLAPSSTEQHDEWAVGRRYLTPAILILNEALPEADLAEATAA